MNRLIKNNDGNKRSAYVLVLLICGGGIGFTLRTIDRGNALAPADHEEFIFSAETIEEHFQAALKHDNDVDQRHASRAIFANLGIDELVPLAVKVEKFAADISEHDEGVRGWILCNEFYRRWGELAPHDAFEFLKTHKSGWSGLTESVWAGWVVTDPEAAIAAYSPALESEYSREIQDNILDALCSIDPAKALRFADAQEMGSDYIFRPENWEEIYESHSASFMLLEYIPIERPYETFGLAVYSWIYRDPDAAFEEMLTLKYDSLKNACLNALFSNWLIRDPDTALLALNKINNHELRVSTTHVAMQAYLLRFPKEAFEKIIRLPKYSDDEEYSAFPFSESNQPLPYRYCNTTATRTYSRIDLISEAGALLGIADGKAAWNRAATIDDENIRAAALGGVLAGWLIYDLDEAAAFSAESIASQSFIIPGGSDFPDFAARIVSKYLAEHDFQKAIAWVEALPAGPLREAGIETASETWLDRAWDRALKEASPQGWVREGVFQKAQRREYAPVMEWLATLPPSVGRDKAANWLTFKLRDLDDPSDALKWAGAIGDERLRSLSFASLAKKIFNKKNVHDKENFNFEDWASAHPKLAEEMKQELLRAKKNKGGSDEE